MGRYFDPFAANRQIEILDVDHVGKKIRHLEGGKASILPIKPGLAYNASGLLPGRILPVIVGPMDSASAHHFKVSAHQAVQTECINAIKHPVPRVDLATLGIVKHFSADVESLLEEFGAAAATNLDEAKVRDTIRGLKSIGYGHEKGALWATVELDHRTLFWKGRVEIDMLLPQTYLAGLAGIPLRDVVEHPAFEDERIRIKSASHFIGKTKLEIACPLIDVAQPDAERIAA